MAVNICRCWYAIILGAAGNNGGGIRPEAITSEVDRAIAKAVRGLARTGSPFICIAGLSGALAVAMGAYGAHGKLILYFLYTRTLCSTRMVSNSLKSFLLFFV